MSPLNPPTGQPTTRTALGPSQSQGPGPNAPEGPPGAAEAKRLQEAINAIASIMLVAKDNDDKVRGIAAVIGASLCGAGADGIHAAVAKTGVMGPDQWAALRAAFPREPDEDDEDDDEDRP